MRTGRKGTVSCRAFVVRFNDENCFHYVMIEQQNMKGSRSMAGSASNIFVERLVESVIIDGHKVGSKDTQRIFSQLPDNHIFGANNRSRFNEWIDRP